MGDPAALRHLNLDINGDDEMGAQFSNDYRTVRDRLGTVLCLSAVQGQILRFLAERDCPCTHREVRDALHDAGYETQSLRHAFYAADGRRVWGALIRPSPTSRDHLMLDRNFVAKPPRGRPRRPRPRDGAKKLSLGDQLGSLFRNGRGGG